jgi:phage terminase small subunit
MSDLSPKQERFIQEYLVDLNGTQAAIRAGYSVHTAASIGWELLRNPEGEPAKVEYTHKVRTYDKIAALTQLGRHLGMFQDKIHIEGKLSLEDLVMGVIRKEQAEKGDHQP